MPVAHRGHILPARFYPALCIPSGPSAVQWEQLKREKGFDAVQRVQLQLLSLQEDLLYKD